MSSAQLPETNAEYHLRELEIARNASAPGHLLPDIPAGCRAVLDIGCGAGQTLIACELPPGTLACGVDVDVGALALGRTLSDRIGFVSARGEQLPFADGTFDLVLSRVALPYMNVPAALREMARVLAPGGRIWLSLHPPEFALRTMRSALRRRSLRGVIYPLYTLLNALLLQMANRQVRWPFGRRGYESTQTAAGIRRALRRAGFDAIELRRDRFFVVTARKAPI